MSRLRLPFESIRAFAVCATLIALFSLRAAAQYDEVWITKVGARGTNGFHVVGRELAPDGRLWVAASVLRKHPVDPWSGIQSLLLLRFDPDGRLEWSRNLFNTLPYTGVLGALRVDSRGCAYVASRRDLNCSIVKYSPRGVELWRRPLNLTWVGGDEVPMAIDGEGRVIVAGNTPGVRSLDNDLQLAQYDSDGNLRWQVSFAGPQQGFDYAHHVAADAAGRVHLTAVSSKKQYDPGNVILSLAFDGDGTLLWSTEYGTSDADRLYAQATEVQPDGTRTIAVGVHDPDEYWWSQTAFALVRIGPAGERLWTVVEPNVPLQSRTCRELRTAPWGDLIVAGASIKYSSPTTFHVNLKALAEAFSPTGEKLWSQKSSTKCKDTWFGDVLIFGDQGRVGFVTRTGTEPTCYPFLAFCLEFFSAQGAPLDAQRIDFPGSSGSVTPTGLVDAEGDLRLIATTPLPSMHTAWVLFAARYTLSGAK